MSAPLVPSPLDYIGRRRFAFYPPIKNINSNEWVLGACSWAEVQIVDSSTGGEIWIPRQYIGAVSESSGPILIVGLRKELQYRAGNLEPRVKRVIEMPAAADQPVKLFAQEPKRAPGPAPVVGIRVENREDSPMSKALVILGAGALIAFLDSNDLSTRASLIISCAAAYMDSFGR